MVSLPMIILIVVKISQCLNKDIFLRDLSFKTLISITLVNYTKHQVTKVKQTQIGISKKKRK